MRWLDGVTDAMNMNMSTLRETVKDKEEWHAAVHGVTVRHDLATEQQIITSKLVCYNHDFSEWQEYIEASDISCLSSKKKKMLFTI